MYTIANVKTFRGREGQGFNASLYRDGVKVALVIDSADGGAIDYEWLDYKAPKIEVKRKGQDFTARLTPEEKMLEDYATSLPVEKTSFGDLKYDPDLVISKLVDDYNEQRMLKRSCKKKTLFRILNDHVGEWRTLNAPYDSATHLYIIKKYGKAVETILNREAEAVTF